MRSEDLEETPPKTTISSSNLRELMFALENIATAEGLRDLPKTLSVPFEIKKEIEGKAEEADVLKHDGSRPLSANWSAGYVISCENIKFTAAPASDHLASGILISLTAAVALNFGDACYINSDGKAALGDADAIATASCIIMCADASIAENASGNFLLIGVARDDTWTWTPGGLIYLSTTGTTGNTLTQTAPSGTDDVIQILGVATHADRMIFSPQLVQVEHT